MRATGHHVPSPVLLADRGRWCWGGQGPRGVGVRASHSRDAGGCGRCGLGISRRAVLLADVPEFLCWSLCGGLPCPTGRIPFGTPAALSVALRAIFWLCLFSSVLRGFLFGPSLTGASCSLGLLLFARVRATKFFAGQPLFLFSRATNFCRGCCQFCWVPGVVTLLWLCPPTEVWCGGMGPVIGWFFGPCGASPSRVGSSWLIRRRTRPTGASCIPCRSGA